MEQNRDNTLLYTIGTVARMLGVSVQTLRLYEQQGLLVVGKSAGNQRLYTPADVERLRCIRKAITEEKISIEGIRRIHSLIPCWEHVRCPMDQRLACPAYGAHTAGCWTYRHEANACADRDCRSCEVYRLSSDCGSIKRLIQQSLGGTAAVTHTLTPEEEHQA